MTATIEDRERHAADLRAREEGLRLPNASGVAARLMDGHEWLMRPPEMISAYPVFQGETMGLRVGSHYGSEWDRRFDEAIAHFKTGEDAWVSMWDHLAWFAVKMLEANYRLEIRKLYPEILRFDLSIRESFWMGMAVWKIIAGPITMGETDDGGKIPPPKPPSSNGSD